MTEDDQRNAIPLTPDYLSTLDKTQLADLLHNRTSLLSVATHLDIKNIAYVEGLKKDTEMLIEAIRERKI